jgi:hypothetical protein
MWTVVGTVVDEGLVGLVSTDDINYEFRGGEERSYFTLLTETRVKWTSPPSGMLFSEVLLL